MNSSITRLLIIILVVSCGCSAQKPLQLVGLYKSCNASLIQKYRTGYDLDGIATLQLAQDATFDYSTCTNTITGHWQQQGDSVLLWCSLNLRKIGEKEQPVHEDTLSCGTEPIYLQIKKGQLWETMIFNHKELMMPFCRQ